jgi:chromosome segregation ATPase
MRTITDQNGQIIALQNSVDEALDAKRAMRKELDDAEKRMALRDTEHAAELEKVRAEFGEKVAGLEKVVMERDGRIAELERKVAAKDRRIDELLARIAELEKANRLAVAEREQVEAKLNALQARVNHANGEGGAAEPPSAPDTDEAQS